MDARPWQHWLLTPLNRKPLSGEPFLEPENQAFSWFLKHWYIVRTGPYV